MGRPSLFAPAPAFDRLALAWAAIALLQIGLLLFFASLLVFEIDGERVWAVSDDIYISACYARNIAAGHGAVWFPGAQPVEGFSNPLWTAILVVVHRLPFFREADLGLYVLVLQAAILVAALGLSLSVLRALLALAGGPVDLRAGRLAAVVAVSLGWASLDFWLSEGFEIGLVLLLALLAFRLALSASGAGRAAAIGALAGIAFWTRMDGPLVCAGAFLLLATGGGWNRSHVAIAVSTLAVFAAGQFLLRRAVFGEWVPNTYWLKLGGWPLGDRIAAGLSRNAPLLPALGLAWVLFLLPGVRAALGAALRPALALLATATMLVAYSVHNGGDSWNLRLGFDRFGAPGSVLLGIALALLLLRASLRGAQLGVAAAAALAIALSPALVDPNLKFVANLARGKFTATEKTFIGYGRAFEACSRPGARILVGAAGAIVYFSHRGGHDFLGKCDPWVARQPVNSTRHTSGHNKRYAKEVFERDRPEFSREPPPPELAREYRECAMRGHRVWVRRDGPNVIWEQLTVLK